MLHLQAHGRRDRKRLALKLALLALVACAGLMVYARTARRASGGFAPADDFPRGPLVYAQFKDLPALFRQWNDSALKERYLDSVNFEQLQESHLWLKLSERWNEFNDAFGFMLDAEALAGTTENGAAIAVYDIGRLDMVLVAPLSEEKLAASKFFTSRDKFEETELPDGTTYYSLSVDVDRGRQKQQLSFASAGGRFVLATSERLLLRALANINGKARKDRLSDDTAFKSLSEKVQPHFVSVWVDQSKLNADYYFKHYWLMKNTEQFRNVRACLFDLELADGRWTERRDLLYANGRTQARASIPGPEAQRLASMIPGGVPYFKLRALNEGAEETSATALVRDTMLDRVPRSSILDQKNWAWQSYSDADFELSGEEEEWYGETPYSSLDGDYDAAVDDPADAGVTQRLEPGENPLRAEAETRFAADLQKALAPARPLWAATMTSPRTMDGPLFVEFRRATILTLNASGNLNRDAFESAVGEAVGARLLAAGSSANLKWTGAGEEGARWRQLELPMSGWELCYAVAGRDLIVSNSADLLRSILTAGPQKSSARESLSAAGAASLDDLTVIDLEQRKQAFDDVFDKLDAQAVKSYWKRRGQSSNAAHRGASQEFFSGNVRSLLDAASGVRRVEIKRNSLPDRLHEEIDYVLQ